jgi:transposase
MKNELNYVAGIDISKKTFDISVGKNEGNSKVKKTCFSNNLLGYEELENWLDEQSIKLDDILICLENTGIYHRQLVGYLLSKKAYVWIETPVRIKWSMGIQRGKSDTADCERIMRYAYRHQEQAKFYQIRDKNIQQIADYMSLRERLKTCIKSLKIPIKEFRAAGLLSAAESCEAAIKESLKSMDKELKSLELKIKMVIDTDKNLSRLYQYITSVRCVGFVAACYLLVYTEGFTRFDNAKQIASFAGVAPFEYSSGTSIKGRTKVHPMANKTLKQILHMCAVSSVRHNPEMVTYFNRKVAEGKNKMLVLNAIRNKIIHRVFACVKNEKMYVMDYKRA